MALTAGDFVVGTCQATMFTPDAEVSTARVMARLLPQWLDRFDAEPAVLPLPEGIPREIPRITLNSRSKRWRCEIASGRISLVWQRSSPAEGDIGPAQVFRETTPLLLEYFDFLGERVGRLAAVLSRFAPCDTPGRQLAVHFCQERWLQAPLNRPENFELHAHKVFQMAGRYKVNSWVRNKTGNVTEGKQSARAVVLVEQDVNTLAEEAATRAVTRGEISDFFEVVGPAFDEALQLYYPAHERG